MQNVSADFSGFLVRSFLTPETQKQFDKRKELHAQAQTGAAADNTADGFHTVSEVWEYLQKVVTEYLAKKPGTADGSAQGGAQFTPTDQVCYAFSAALLACHEAYFTYLPPKSDDLHYIDYHEQGLSSMFNCIFQGIKFFQTEQVRLHPDGSDVPAASPLTDCTCHVCSHRL